MGNTLSLKRKNCSFCWWSKTLTKSNYWMDKFWHILALMNQVIVLSAGVWYKPRVQHLDTKYSSMSEVSSGSTGEFQEVLQLQHLFRLHQWTNHIRFKWYESMHTLTLGSMDSRMQVWLGLVSRKSGLSMIYYMQTVMIHYVIYHNLNNLIHISQSPHTFQNLFLSKEKKQLHFHCMETDSARWPNRLSWSISPIMAGNGGWSSGLSLKNPLRSLELWKRKT